MISSKNLANAIYEISLSSKQKEDVIAGAILAYVKEYKMESILEKVLTRLEDKANKNLIWNTLFIKSGLVINDSIIDEIKKKLKAENTKNITNKIDKDLIGGFVAIYKGIIYDASIYNQLQLLRNTLTK